MKRTLFLHYTLAIIACLVFIGCSKEEWKEIIIRGPLYRDIKIHTVLKPGEGRIIQSYDELTKIASVDELGKVPGLLDTDFTNCTLFFGCVISHSKYKLVDFYYYKTNHNTYCLVVDTNPVMHDLASISSTRASEENIKTDTICYATTVHKLLPSESATIKVINNKK